MSITSKQGVIYDRHDDTGAAASVHVAYQGLGDEAGAEGAAVAMGAWVSVSAERCYDDNTIKRIPTSETFAALNKLRI